MNSETSHLLEEARRLLTYSDKTTAGSWPRAAALLTRQALEQAVDDFWRRCAPGVENCSYRVQLLCLRSYADERVAEEAGHTWAALVAPVTSTPTSSRPPLPSSTAGCTASTRSSVP